MKHLCRLNLASGLPACQSESYTIWLSPPVCISLVAACPVFSCRVLGLKFSKTHPKEKSWSLNLFHVTANKGATLEINCIHVIQAKRFVSRISCKTQHVYPRTSGDTSDTAALIKLLSVPCAHLRLEQEEFTKGSPSLFRHGTPR